MYASAFIVVILVLNTVQDSAKFHNTPEPHKSYPNRANVTFNTGPDSLLLSEFERWRVPQDQRMEQSEEHRIVGGEPAHISDAPYQVGIRYIKFPVIRPVWRSIIICGGSLIGPRLVLSAAHCFASRIVNPYVYRVTLGCTYRDRKNAGAEVRDVDKLILHPKFRLSPVIKFDVALVVLDSNVQESVFIKAVALASQPVQERMPCLITGWGRQQFFTESLRKAIVPVLNLAECRRRSALQIAEGFFCAGYFEGGIDACSGDSGGPLVCDGVQYGIVSYGKGCAERNNPGVYLDVYYNMEWIMKESVNGAKYNLPSTVLFVMVFIASFDLYLTMM